MQNCEGSERRFLFENNKQPLSTCNFPPKSCFPTPKCSLFTILMQPANLALKQRQIDLKKKIRLRFQACFESPMFYILKELKGLILVEEIPNNHHGMVSKPTVNDGINYQPQLTGAFRRMATVTEAKLYFLPGRVHGHRHGAGEVRFRSGPEKRKKLFKYAYYVHFFLCCACWCICVYLLSLVRIWHPDEGRLYMLFLFECFFESFSSRVEV